MIIVIGSSSKLSLEISNIESNTFFIGRSNPYNIEKWVQGGDLSSVDGIDESIKQLEKTLNNSKANDSIHLVLLNGVSSQNWELSINVNMLATAKLSESFCEYLKTKNLIGSVTLIGSASSYLGGKIPYSMTKASLIGLMNSLNSKFSPGIRSNIILPGAFESGMIEDWSEEKKVKVSQTTNQKRIATTNEITEAIMFCTNNTYLSGSTINMTSGVVK